MAKPYRPIYVTDATHRRLKRIAKLRRQTLAVTTDEGVRCLEAQAKRKDGGEPRNAEHH